MKNGMFPENWRHQTPRDSCDKYHRNYNDRRQTAHDTNYERSGERPEFCHFGADRNFRGHEIPPPPPLDGGFDPGYAFRYQTQFQNYQPNVMWTQFRHEVHDIHLNHHPPNRVFEARYVDIQTRGTLDPEQPPWKHNGNYNGPLPYVPEPRDLNGMNALPKPPVFQPLEPGTAKPSLPEPPKLEAPDPNGASPTDPRDRICIKLKAGPIVNGAPDVTPELKPNPFKATAQKPPAPESAEGDAKPEAQVPKEPEPRAPEAPKEPGPLQPEAPTEEPKEPIKVPKKRGRKKKVVTENTELDKAKDAEPRSENKTEEHNQTAQQTLSEHERLWTKKQEKRKDTIANLLCTKKITRQAQNFYESQLKLAIEMSMKESMAEKKKAEDNAEPAAENEPADVKNNEPESEEAEITPEEDEDSDFDLKPKRRGMKRAKKTAPEKKPKQTKAPGPGRRNAKLKKPADLTPQANGAFSDASLSLSASSSSSFAREQPKQDSQTPKAAKRENGFAPLTLSLESLREEKTDLDEDLDEHSMNEAKMKVFEEYLSMSEKMYCGRTLVDEALNAKLNEEAGTTNKSLRRLPSRKSRAGYRDHDLRSNASNSSDELNALRETRLWNSGHKEAKNPLLGFKCANLDLMCRVSFNILKSAYRQPQVIDLWGPKEIVLFELALFKHGKEFHEIQKDIPSKSVREIVDMYYMWKKSSRYKLWKANRFY